MLGPTPSIPSTPDDWNARAEVTLTLAIDDHIDHSVDGFAQSANPLVFRSQAVTTDAESFEQVPPEQTRAARGDTIAAVSSAEYEKVVGRVRASYLARLQRCFGVGPQKASGKLQLAFTVAQSGQVSDARVTGLDAGTNACVRKRVLRWSFASDRESSGEASIVLSLVVM